MRTPIVAANWKMHGTRQMTRDLIRGIAGGVNNEWNVEILICPPFVYIDEASRLLEETGIALGAQNVNQHPGGAHTGEISAAMLADLGCSHVIVGHSERRAMYADDDAKVAANFQAAQDAGLIPVLCVGESLAQREQGITDKVVRQQLEAVLEVAGVDGFSRAVVAYEPVWAIGTGLTATPAQAQDAHEGIRGLITAQNDKIAADLRILYGGSVKGSNARALFDMPDIDGGLIGGASLKLADFLAICEAAGTDRVT